MPLSLREEAHKSEPMQAGHKVQMGSQDPPQDYPSEAESTNSCAAHAEEQQEHKNNGADYRLREYKGFRHG